MIVVGGPPAPASTIDIERTTVSSRLLDSKLTEGDREFIRGAVIFTRGDHYRMTRSARLLNLLKLKAEEITAEGVVL